jgi:hypothetical protein
MSTIAYGAEKINALQYALGGKPPARSGKQARMLLKKYAAERFKTLKAALREEVRLTAHIRDRLFSRISKDDPGVKRTTEEVRRFVERRRKRKIPRPKIRRIEPRFVAAPFALFRVPPYDDGFVSTTGGEGNSVSVDKEAGNYKIGLFSAGDGLQAGSAGVGIWFFSTVSDPMTRVGAELDYSDNWYTVPYWNVAANELRTRIWVWGDKEQNWVVQSGDLQPSWGDRVSGWDGHGNDESGQTSQIFTFFPAQANQFYLAWIWSGGSVYAENKPFGPGFSQVDFSTAVPAVAFGGIFR